jgi:hypothetical protein
VSAAAVGVAAATVDATAANKGLWAPLSPVACSTVSDPSAFNLAEGGAEDCPAIPAVAEAVAWDAVTRAAEEAAVRPLWG